MGVDGAAREVVTEEEKGTWRKQRENRCREFCTLALFLCRMLTKISLTLLGLERPTGFTSAKQAEIGVWAWQNNRPVSTCHCTCVLHVQVERRLQSTRC